VKSDRAHIAAGLAGTAIVAICCGLPLLVAALLTTGVTVWLADAEWLLVLAPLLCLGVFGLRLYRRRTAAQACCDQASRQKKV
jgi:hypothetical protein